MLKNSFQRRAGFVAVNVMAYVDAVNDYRDYIRPPAAQGTRNALRIVKERRSFYAG
jgi:hypothetical protein